MSNDEKLVVRITEQVHINSSTAGGNFGFTSMTRAQAIAMRDALNEAFPPKEAANE